MLDQQLIFILQIFKTWRLILDGNWKTPLLFFNFPKKRAGKIEPFSLVRLIWINLILRNGAQTTKQAFFFTGLKVGK